VKDNREKRKTVGIAFIARCVRIRLGGAGCAFALRRERRKGT